MSSLQIASGIIESLREENRLSSEALHQAQTNIKLLEKDLCEKQQIIGILEGRLRLGTNTYLESSNRQKDLTIKHLELQIQKLFKQNEELEFQLNILKSEVCPRCETKVFLGIADEKIESKPVRIAKSAPAKKGLQRDYADRQKMLERIVEHKDRRIMHLSKEIQRLTANEKELNNKIYRLSKLLPLSNMPSQVLIDCLLKEIQLLESQIKSQNELFDKKQPSVDGALSSKHFPQSAMTAGISSARRSKTDSADKLQSKLSKSLSAIAGEKDSVTNLHLLYNEINDLKYLFQKENEKLQQCLNRDSLKNDILRIEWKDIISRLNDIADTIQNIIRNSSSVCNCKCADAASDKDDVILQLQEKLRDALELSTEYKDENNTLQKKVSALSEQLAHLENSNKKSIEALTQLQDERYQSKQSFSSFDKNDVQKLKELLDIKQSQLDAADKHIRTCQEFISQLQNSLQKSVSNTAIPAFHYNENADPLVRKTRSSTEVELISNSKEDIIRTFQIKLETSNKNVINLENIVEGLQNKISHLEEVNQLLNTDLRIAKNKASSEKLDQVNSSLQMKVKNLKSQLDEKLKENTDLNEELASLKEENKTIQERLHSCVKDNESLRASSQGKDILQTKLNTAEKHIDVVEERLVKLQTDLESVRREKETLKSELKDSKSRNQLTEAYEEDVVALKNELNVKEDEVKILKQSLNALESKTLEMNHYRRALRKEIENLCSALMEDSGSNLSTEHCRAIYKAAVLRSAQALLQFDVDDSKVNDSEQSSALEELKHQVSIYLTEVARINELLTLKNQQREDLLREYLDVNEQENILGRSLSHEMNLQGTSSAGLGIESLPRFSKTSSRSDIPTSAEPDMHYVDKNVQTSKSVTLITCESSSECLKKLREELKESKSLAAYFMSNCTRLEDMLREEQSGRSKFQQESGRHLETIQLLKNQLKDRNNHVKQLDSIINMMRSKQCTDEIGIEQQKSQIDWLVSENQKLFDKITSTDADLCKCKEENSRIINDLNNMKRQLLDEKYENAKVNSELKHLRQQITQNESSASNI